jgi:endonuclease YncB( thermonuclease family)
VPRRDRRNAYFVPVPGFACSRARDRRVDQYGRLLRYVVRVHGVVNVNIRLVAVGAAAPYFYMGRRGRYANRLEVLAKRARVRKLALWKGARTPYDPYEGVQARR